MLQEQVCEYLGVKSFKRKYPGKCYREDTLMMISNSFDITYKYTFHMLD